VRASYMVYEILERRKMNHSRDGEIMKSQRLGADVYIF
jgi:hypothetical protein